MAKKKLPATFRPPEAITDEHLLESFDCGEPSLNDWLRRRALTNEANGASRTYVVCLKAGMEVIAYYCLAAGAVGRAAALGAIRRNMPEPIPVMVIGRLAVDRRYKNQRIGSSLVRDAVLRTTQAASIVGIRAILVHAIGDDARQFYERCGFRVSPLDPKMLMIGVGEAEKALK